MVSTQDKRKLLERIKNETKHYEIRLEGEGCETVMGFITAEAYQYWHKKSDRDFGNYVAQYRDMNMLNKVPTKAQLTREWFEYDDIAHVTGVLLNNKNTLYIDQYNEDFQYEDTVLSIPLESTQLRDSEVNLVMTSAHNYESMQLIDRHYFLGVSREKGAWYTEEKIKTKLYNFDMKNLWLKYCKVEDMEVIHEIEYDGFDYFLTADTKGLKFDIGVRKGINKQDFGKKTQKNIWIDS